METERRQFRKSGDRLAGRNSSDAGAFGLVSLHKHAHRIYLWCVKEKSKLETKLVGGRGAGERDKRSKDRSRTEWARGQGLPSGRYTQNPETETLS